MKSKRKFAAALRHDATSDQAPVVTAKGHGTVAEKKLNKLPMSQIPLLL